MASVLDIHVFQNISHEQEKVNGSYIEHFPTIFGVVRNNFLLDKLKCTKIHVDI